MKKMNSVKLPVVILVTLLLAGSVLPSILTNNDRYAKAGESYTNTQGSDRAFYKYHSVYSQSEINKHYSTDQISTEQQKTINGIGVNQKNNTEETTQATAMGPLDSPWPMMSHDVHHTGRSPYNTTQPPEGVEKWRFGASDSFDGGAVIDDEGILYFGGMDCHLYAVYPNGTLKWKTNLYRCIESTPAIDENGIIYVGTIWGDNYLFAVYSNNGTLKWGYRTGNHVDSSPAIGGDGTIYFGDWNGIIHALHPDGTVKWEYHTGDAITGSPAIGPDGTVYIGSHDSHLYAFNPENGTVKWSFPAGGWVRVSPCVGDDGTVYCVSFDNYLYAIYPNNGTMKWRTFVNAGTNPTIGPDGTIYAGYDYLHAINPSDGSIRWEVPAYGYMEGGTPCTSKEGIIYYGTTNYWHDDGSLVAMNPDGSLRWKSTIGACESPPAIDSNGWIYIGSESPGAAIHAFGHGPLHAEIYGPYEGSATVPIQFTGDIFGGIPPYTCLWDFGDNQSSSEQNPKHAYAHYGVYTATFIVIDSQGNQSSDSCNVTVHYAPPTVYITKPVNGIYFMNMRILPFPGVLIFGPITIEVNASQEQFGIDRVDFWLDNLWLKTWKHLTVVTDPPYSCTWRSPALFNYYISVQVFDNSGNYTYAGIYVWKFF